MLTSILSLWRTLATASDVIVESARGHAKRHRRRRYRLQIENENVDEKICRRAKKSRKSSSAAVGGCCRNQSCRTNKQLGVVT